MKTVRLGIIGVGSMGTTHAHALLAGKVPRCKLTALCDIKPQAMEAFPQLLHFENSKTLIESGEVDAVIISTPHYAHTTIGIEALKAGLHVLVEKPISVHKADCERLIAAHKNPKQVFCAMFNQRTDPSYIKLRQLIQDGSLGTLRRVSWIITNWFRTQSYYDHGDWRATWGGEGGGVLLNQCPHQLDLWWWLFGMPQNVRSFCQIGRYHDIEVEDDVTTVMLYENGMTGTFQTTTGEAPGTNRLEVVGDQGKVVIEDGSFQFTRNEVSMSEFCQTCPGRFDRPPTWDVNIPVPEGHGPQHNGVLLNFTDAILDGAKLETPASEGIYSVELANAMLMSSFEDRTVKLPINSAAYEKLLKSKIETSSYVKKTRADQPIVDDFAKSFS